MDDYVSRSASAGLHLEVLSRAQVRLLPRLGLFRKHGFYLAGGTALAMQLGHRTSIDFDFYSVGTFEPEPLLSEIHQAVRKTMQIQVMANTLILECDKVPVSLFHYPYRLLTPLTDTGEVLLASVEDIGAMKVVAIIQRGRRRDFIDCYYLIRKFGLKRLLSLAGQKYPDFNAYLALQGLAYFGDAEPENRTRAIQTRVSWKTVREFIEAEVKRMSRDL